MSEYVYGTDGQEGHWLTGEEIVRCRDCKHFNGWACEQSECFCCGELTHRVEPDGFCAWGEARKHGGTTGAASGSELVR